MCSLQNYVEQPALSKMHSQHTQVPWVVTHRLKNADVSSPLHPVDLNSTFPFLSLAAHLPSHPYLSALEAGSPTRARSHVSELELQGSARPQTRTLPLLLSRPKSEVHLPLGSILQLTVNRTRL